MFFRAKSDPKPNQISSHILSKIELVQWNISRYDAIRNSTASRASLLVSADALLLTGSALLLNFYAQGAGGDWLRDASNVAFLLVFTATLVALISSIWFCVGAIAAYKTSKTSRNEFTESIPSRFLFNWGDTLRAGRKYEEFYSHLIRLSDDDILQAASTELWTAVYQHARKHRNLRMGIRLFRASLVFFVLLAVVTVAHRF
jgi:hypothetical protein